MKKVISLIMTFAMFATMFSGTAYAALPSDASGPQDWIDSGVSVIVVGDYEFTSRFTKESPVLSEARGLNTEVDFSDKITYVDSLSALPSVYTESPNNDIAAIVISQDAIDMYTSENTEKIALETLLDQGNVAYFPNTTYRNMSNIFESITGDSFNMEPVDANNSDCVTAYVLKDSAGNYYTGNIIAPGEVSQEIIDERILVETVENRSIYATGRASSDFEPGYQWNQLSTWHKNSFAAELTKRIWFSEWICFYSTQTPDGDHYYAWAGEWCMEPYKYNGVQWVSDYVKYESGCSGLQDGIQLRDYWPQNEPSSSTGSVSMGINSDRSYDFGLSYDWEIKDLSFTDNSRPSQEYCKLQWDFNHPMIGLGYDAEVSYAKFAMIFKDTLKADSYTFHHYRTAYLFARNMMGESSGANYRSTYDFKP